MWKRLVRQVKVFYVYGNVDERRELGNDGNQR